MFKKFQRAWKAFKNELNKSESNTKWYDVFDFGQKNGNAVNETIYYICLRLLSETIAKMPLKLFRDNGSGAVKISNDVYEVLHSRPNKFVTPAAFWSAIVRNMKHSGNAYVYINKQYNKKTGKYVIVDFWVMPSENVEVYYDDKYIFSKSANPPVSSKGDLYYYYVDNNGETHVFPGDDVLHFKNSLSKSGIMGESVIDYLGNVISGNLQNENFVNSLSENGMRAKALLKFTAELSDEEIEKYMGIYKKYLNGKKMTVF